MTVFLIGNKQDKVLAEEITSSLNSINVPGSFFTKREIKENYTLLLEAEVVIILFHKDISQQSLDISLQRQQKGKVTLNLFPSAINLTKEQKNAIGKNPSVFKTLSGKNSTEELISIIDKYIGGIDRLKVESPITQEENSTENEEVIPEDWNYHDSSKSRSNVWIWTILSILIIGAAIGYWWYQKEIIGTSKNIVEAEEETIGVEEPNDEIITQEFNDEDEISNVITPLDIVYLSGKIDGKYPVHMILDLNQREGIYYYDKYGPTNTIAVEISQLHEIGENLWNVTLTKLRDQSEYQEKWYGVLNGEKFTGTGEYLDNEMPFELMVNSISTDSTDPMIEKSKSASESKNQQWFPIEFSGYVESGRSLFPVKITAVSDREGNFRNAEYYNINYNVNFPVDIVLKDDQVIITRKSSSSDFLIKATNNGSGDYKGYMQSDGNNLPIQFTTNYL